MKCQELLKLLNDYVDGDVDVPSCAEFEKHLKDCNPCRIVVDTMRQTITLYRGQEVYDIPAPFREKLHDVLRRKWEDRQL